MKGIQEYITESSDVTLTLTEKEKIFLNCMIDVIWNNPMIEGDVKKAVLNSKEMKEANDGKKLEGYPFDLFWKALRKKVKDLDK